MCVCVSACLCYTLCVCSCGCMCVFSYWLVLTVTVTVTVNLFKCPKNKRPRGLPLDIRLSRLYLELPYMQNVLAHITPPRGGVVAGLKDKIVHTRSEIQTLHYGIGGSLYSTMTMIIFTLKSGQHATQCSCQAHVIHEKNRLDSDSGQCCWAWLLTETLLNNHPTGPTCWTAIRSRRQF